MLSNEIQSPKVAILISPKFDGFFQKILEYCDRIFFFSFWRNNAPWKTLSCFMYLENFIQHFGMARNFGNSKK